MEFLTKMLRSVPASQQSLPPTPSPRPRLVRRRQESSLRKLHVPVVIKQRLNLTHTFHQSQSSILRPFQTMKNWNSRDRPFKTLPPTMKNSSHKDRLYQDMDLSVQQ